MKKYIILIMITLAVDLFAQQTVRDYIINEWKDSRYTDHGNGTVTDTKTGLMWKQCSEGQNHTNGCDQTGDASNHNWEEALELAKASQFANYSDWRLPNIKELFSLAAKDRFNPAINETLFPNTPSDWFRSSSPYASSGTNAWNLNFSYGYDAPYHTRSNSNRNIRVRLVRFAQ